MLFLLMGFISYIHTYCVSSSGIKMVFLLKMTLFNTVMCWVVSKAPTLRPEVKEEWLIGSRNPILLDFSLHL